MAIRLRLQLVTAASVLSIAALVAGCASAQTIPTPQPSPVSSVTPSLPTPSPTPGIAPASFDLTFSAMEALKPTVAAGSGMVGVILPNGATRYLSFDTPYFLRAFRAAGYSPSDFRIDNARGNQARQVALARADIAAGAKVLIVGPVNDAAGAQIQALAQQHGVALVAYDKAIFGGTNTFFAGYDPFQIGKLIGQGFIQCVADWGVTSPMVFELDGGVEADPKAVSLAQGYNSVIWGQAQTPISTRTVNSLGYTLVTEIAAPRWDHLLGAQVFAQEFKTHSEINATLEAGDALADGVIANLRARGIPARKIPTTGQDATVGALAWILRDYQCGTVYKPIYPEVQAAVALATFLRAGQKPPSSLIDGTANDPAKSSISQPAVLLVPVWVDKSNLAATVVKDGFVSAALLCRIAGAKVCTANGITP